MPDWLYYPLAALLGVAIVVLLVWLMQEKRD